MSSSAMPAPSDPGPPGPPGRSAAGEALFQERILAHYRHPRNRGPLAGASRSAELSNPLCGDIVRVHVALADDGRTVREARFEGDACSLTVASASMMTELVVGRTPAEVADLARRFAALVAGDADAARDDSLGELLAFQGVARLPARRRCATMPWEALARALGA